MGYETEIIIVEEYSFDHKVQLHDRDESLSILTGGEIARLKLSKCGNGPVGKLIEKSKPKTPKYGIWSQGKDRQQEAVEVIRSFGEDDKYLNVLADEIEDSAILYDLYNTPIGSVSAQEFLKALKEEKEVLKGDTYRRFVIAEKLIKSIVENFEHSEISIRTFGY